MQVIIQRVALAWQTVPTLAAWIYAVMLLFVYALVALPVGFVSGFVHIDGSQLSWRRVGFVLAGSLLSPALSEELVFRVLFLPNPVERVGTIARWSAAAISVVLFVIYHPANAYSFFPAGQKVFVDPAFLFLAALLGLICTLAYFQSGSLWTPVFLHWIVVAVWLLILGGYQKLHA